MEFLPVQFLKVKVTEKFDYVVKIDCSYWKFYVLMQHQYESRKYEGISTTVILHNILKEGIYFLSNSYFRFFPKTVRGLKCVKCVFPFFCFLLPTVPFSVLQRLKVEGHRKFLLITFSFLAL